MTKPFLLNVLLTVVWVALTGNYEFANYVFGFVLSFCVMWVSRIGDHAFHKYFTALPGFIGLFFFFLYELIKANLHVAYEVITPGFGMTPGIIRIPLDVKSDLEITLLANMITLTPGTLSLDVSADKKVLYVHAMYVKDKEKFIQEIKNGFEKRILKLTR
jgi:multicomponent Na+:H+ antiporter subunit E